LRNTFHQRAVEVHRAERVVGPQKLGLLGVPQTHLRRVVDLRHAQAPPVARRRCDRRRGDGLARTGLAEQQHEPVTVQSVDRRAVPVGDDEGREVVLQ
jgi:hypothetical protein